MATKKIDNKKVLQGLAEELMGLAGVSVEVEVVEIEEDSYEVNLKTEGETGLLIGFRGENINSIQTVLTLMFKGKTDKWVRVLVNIGDYRQKQEDKIKSLADQTIERAIETKQPQPIYNLTPGQRRIVHMYIAENKKVESVSEGEGDERYLIVKTK
ncbi:KH domain-containing protein [Candidatus Microgenomates bacterium]|nr:KH domain-containing protein [Candidatus Microgenomates bacterium]